MSNYNSLKTTIDANIKQNGRQEITGQILNSVLNQMVTTLGAGYQFAGVATIDTKPGTTDAKVFYIANGKGTYTNFGDINVTEDEVVILYYDTEWHKVATGIASQEKLTELGAQVSNIGIENTSQEGSADLDIADEKGNILVGFADGNIKTKNFDSSKTPYVKQEPTSMPDLDFTDEGGNVLVRFADGNIRTRNFDSSGTPYGKQTLTSMYDLDFTDEKGNILVRFSNGHIKTKNFDSSGTLGTLYVKQESTSTSDLDIADEKGHTLVRFVDGHIKTKNFDSAKFHKPFRTFSVLGDSYSTYAGFIPSGNVTWYPTSAPGEGLGLQNDVDSVKQCWWHLFANEAKCTLIQNESWSGACICYDSYGGGTTDGKTKSFVQRVSKVGKPDLVIIEGGTNDSWAGASMGNYKYSDWTESDFETYRPSLAYVLNYVQEHNPGSTIIFMLNNGLSQEIIESTETICAYYNVNLLKLNNINKQSNHPSKAGMIQIKNQLIKYINNLIL